jgi:hypothetical protein
VSLRTLAPPGPIDPSAPEVTLTAVAPSWHRQLIAWGPIEGHTSTQLERRIGTENWQILPLGPDVRNYTFDQSIHAFGIDILDLSSGLRSVQPNDFAFPTQMDFFPEGDAGPRFFGIISELPFTRLDIFQASIGNSGNPVLSSAELTRFSRNAPGLLGRTISR